MKKKNLFSLVKFVVVIAFVTGAVNSLAQETNSYSIYRNGEVIGTINGSDVDSVKINSDSKELITYLSGVDSLVFEQAAAPAVSVLWEGEFVIAGWTPTLDMGLDYFQSLAVGNTLRFSFSPNSAESWWQIKVCDSNWSGFSGFDATGLENYPDGYADLEVTQEVYDRIAVEGIHVQGANFTLTKVELLQ